MRLCAYQREHGHGSCLLLFGFRNQNSRRLELLQAVRQNVRSDAFTRLLEILKRAKSADHHIADDQQRPAIPENLKGDTDWAAGPALGLRFLRHAGEANKVTCKMQPYFPPRPAR